MPLNNWELARTLFDRVFSFCSPTRIRFNKILDETILRAFLDRRSWSVSCSIRRGSFPSCKQQIHSRFHFESLLKQPSKGRMGREIYLDWNIESDFSYNRVSIYHIPRNLCTEFLTIISFSYSKYTPRIFNLKLSTRTKKLMPVHFRVLLIKLETSAIYCFTYKQDTTELWAGRLEFKLDPYCSSEETYLVCYSSRRREDSYILSGIWSWTFDVTQPI